ncbi:biotin transporter BioY [Tepidibacillus sp. HK-1]|uniref:biotin transporter BioY n=1 Tax=Tepidibacillus sp. HK-1 TaxID=1883407 RepID=UPI000853BECC|nr:biotin transporter BioY [Tepidibacillus sp. HK-1]GBF10589.1 biotin transporter BioY [Tepidibacillus sp. HK-1]
MKLKEMMYVALFTAVVAVLGYLPAIPLAFIPVPITAQTLGVMLAGSVLGAKRGGLSMLVLVLLAAVGAPVLSGGSGGISVLLGPTGGYVLSWPIAAFVIGLLVERSWQNLKVWKLTLFHVIGGILIVYAIGIPYLAVVAKLNIYEALISNLAFIPGDLIKAIVAAVVAMQMKKSYPIIQPSQQVEV